MNDISFKIVEKLCVSFLEAYFGPHGVPTNDEERRSLGLRLVSLGSPELTVHGELVHYLRSKELNAVSECAVGRRSNRDLVIFNHDWAALCAVELKHYSANQGRSVVLFNNMTRDADKHRNGPQSYLPLIQIGLFTEVSQGLGKDHPPTFGLYRFLASYVGDAPNQRIEAQTPPPGFTGNFIAPAPTQFSVGGSAVVGRVGWILRTVASAGNAAATVQGELVAETQAPTALSSGSGLD